MEHVILVIHLILALSIIGLVLIQRSEGGGLGIGGGGGGMGGFATPRTTANALTRMTWTLAACFFCTSLILAIMAGRHTGGTSILDAVPAEMSKEMPADVKDAAEKAVDEVKSKTEDTKHALDEAPAVPVSE